MHGTSIHFAFSCPSRLRLPDATLLLRAAGMVGTIQRTDLWGSQQRWSVCLEIKFLGEVCAKVVPTVQADFSDTEFAVLQRAYRSDRFTSVQRNRSWAVMGGTDSWTLTTAF